MSVNRKMVVVANCFDLVFVVFNPRRAGGGVQTPLSFFFKMARQWRATRRRFSPSLSHLFRNLYNNFNLR